MNWLRNLLDPPNKERDAARVDKLNALATARAGRPRRRLRTVLWVLLIISICLWPVTPQWAGAATSTLIIALIIERIPASRPAGSKRAAREAAQFSTGAGDD